MRTKKSNEMSEEKLSKRDKLYGSLLGLVILCLVALFLQNAGFFGDPPIQKIEIIGTVTHGEEPYRY